MHTAILLLVVASLGVTESAALSVDITPEYEHLQGERDSLTVRCVADAPITHCQFRVTQHTGVQKSVMDLSHQSRVSHFKYEGNGLFNGHCEATIGAAALPNWNSFGSVQCRVRNEDSNWVYVTMSVHRSGDRKIPLTIESRLVVVRPRGEVNLLFQAEEPLSYCRLKHPQQGWKNLPSQLTCVTRADSVCYHGRGMSEGQCGVTIKKISDRSNGCYWFEVGKSPNFEVTHVQVIVTKRPSTPVLSANTVLNADGTTTLRAVCTVVGSRPAANITWVLDGEVLTVGKIDYFPSDTWVREYEEQNNTQQLTLRMTAAMDGKYLSCVVRHVALASPVSSNKVEMELQRALVVDQCNPSPCGDNIACGTSNGEAICECVRDIFRKPGRNGCAPDCFNHPDCPSDQSCVNSKCVNLCNPSPCGGNIPCLPLDGAAYCECMRGTYTRPGKNGCAPDCVNHQDCPGHQACVRSKCVDPTDKEECGRSNIQGGMSLVASEMTSTIARRFPWHIGVFKRHEGAFIIWCGGTLIKPNVVISAAHCFWNESAYGLHNASDYKVAGAKLLRGWDDPDPLIQRRDVQAIHIPPLFSGLVIGHLASDIAVVYLKDAFILNTVVNVACMDWDGHMEDWHLQTGKNGIFAGWGLTEERVQRQTLKYVELPYVPPLDCLNALSRSLKPLLTHDKICAGFVENNTAVCREDSGAGLMFSVNNANKYYLQGVLSTSFSPVHYKKRCNAENVAGFTKVVRFLPWLKSVV